MDNEPPQIYSLFGKLLLREKTPNFLLFSGAEVAIKKQYRDLRDYCRSAGFHVFERIDEFNCLPYFFAMSPVSENQFVYWIDFPGSLNK